MKRDLLGMLDVREDLEAIIDLGIDLKKKSKSGKNVEYLQGKNLLMIFEKPSTRTRVSFEVGMSKLGGHAVFLSPKDIQMGRGESIEDTAKVISRYGDIIMYRAFKWQDVEELAKHSQAPVINGLDNREHPCQIVTDLMAIKEHKGKLKGLNFAYFGDGNNNMAHSYLLGCAIVGMSVKIVSPVKYQPDAYFVEKAREIGKKTGAKVEVTDKVEGAAKGMDILATDTWVSMGDEAEKAVRVQEFKGYTIDDKVMKEANKGAVFIHCLPAYYGYEVTKEVAHGPQSIIFDEAENRMWAQMAIMMALLGAKP
ncbi:MAG: ornithine carbamoyltransferase [Thermoplasmata archaeon HGW-Thermoplasmata-2]|nr:MAG: ornithine carbamoyltransferase [Thermoplasmata archaeon HGW-Thermoplasmata-2]